MLKILVTGANGQLGKSLQALLSMQQTSDVFVFADRDQLDLSQTQYIKSYFDQHPVDVIVNCAAYTHVDQAESEIENANKINFLSIKQLAEIAQHKQMKLLHISTDYVFDGLSTKPYTEDQMTRPLSVYGVTKMHGEQAVMATMEHNAFIIRTSWMYSEYGKNFVKTMLKLGLEKKQISVINDQIGSPTYALDLADVIMTILQNQQFRQTNFKTQLYHFANQGNCSWYEFAQTIFQMANINCDLSSIVTSEYPLPARRPTYSVLNNNKIEQDFDLNIPKWETSLKRCIDQLK